jgi:23S rRNA (uracil1939-C5)-methyltransferase
MTRRKRYLGPFEVEIERLGRGGVGVGIAPDGAPVQVRPAPPGGRVRVAPMGRQKGVWQARREALIRPPADGADPPCAVFGLCGGCSLQELALDGQRRAKMQLALEEIFGGPAPAGLDLLPPRGVSKPYGYRNRVELSWLPRRYVSEEAKLAGEPLDGRWMGFHAPGRFDRVVDTERCWLVGDAPNALIRIAREISLAPDAPPCWDNKVHTGFWRQLLVRASSTGEILLGLFTAPGGDAEAAWVERLAEAWLAADLGDSRLVGVVWAENAGVADVARGVVRRTWGRDWIEEVLGDVRYQLSATSFFQTSTEGAVVLYDAVGELLGDARGTLLDLYCGIGAIGLYLRSRFDRIVGIEENAEAVADAAANAQRNGVTNATFVAAKVEDTLDRIGRDEPRVAIVVDPPRAGLHPKVAEALAVARADVLVYVACNPASLGRDEPILAKGGWKMDALRVVDLFPQTGHVEAVARFRR